MFQKLKYYYFFDLCTTVPDIKILNFTTVNKPKFYENSMIKKHILNKVHSKQVILMKIEEFLY